MPMRTEEPARAETAFALAVEQCADTVTRLCCLNLKDPGQAEDLWQETFLALWDTPSMLERPMPEIRKWLITVALNKCRNHNKRQFYRRYTELSTLDIPVYDARAGEVAEALRVIPAKYAQVIYLHYFEGYSVPELAVILSRKENTVKSQLKRGRELLKGVLELESD